MSITSYPALVRIATDGNAVSFAGPTVDAFGRLRTSSPLTLFDSSHRYSDNGLWTSSITGTASSTFSANEGLVNLSVGSASGDEIVRETTKVFSYQPGKSLLVLSTFVLGTAKANLRQRVGYYGVDNGLYFERDGTSLYFVERSIVSGVVTNTLETTKNNYSNSGVITSSGQYLTGGDIRENTVDSACSFGSFCNLYMTKWD